MTNKPIVRRALSLFSYLAIICILAFFVLSRHSPSLSVGDKAPLDEKITLLNGEIVRLGSFLNKPLVINFWATWCPPCQKELPAFSRVAKKYAGRVQFVGPVVDSPRADVLKVRETLQLSYPMGVMTPESRAKWRAHPLPTTYIINPSKQIVWAKTGAVSQKMLEEGIEMALSQGSPAQRIP